MSNENYFDPKTITELKGLVTKWDTRKLIALVDEIDDNWKKGNLFSVAALLRAILDHMPPIFGFPSFDKLKTGYTETGHGTFKKTLERLTSLRVHGNIHLHDPISEAVMIPTETAVDMRLDMEIVLMKIIQEMKKFPVGDIAMLSLFVRKGDEDASQFEFFVLDLLHRAAFTIINKEYPDAKSINMEIKGIYSGMEHIRNKLEQFGYEVEVIVITYQGIPRSST